MSHWSYPSIKDEMSVDRTFFSWIPPISTVNLGSLSFISFIHTLTQDSIALEGEKKDTTVLKVLAIDISWPEYKKNCVWLYVVGRWANRSNSSELSKHIEANISGWDTHSCFPWLPTRSCLDRWRWSPDGLWCFWIHDWSSLRLDATPSTSPPLNLHCIPQPCSNYQQAHAGRAAGWGSAAQNVFSFPNNFSLILAMFGSCRTSFSPLSFNLPYASSHRRPKTLQNIPECKAFAMVTAAQRCLRAVWTERGMRRRVERWQLQRACVKGLDQERGVATLAERRKRKPPGKICTGTTPLKHHLLRMDWGCSCYIASHPLSPLTFSQGKSNLDYEGCKLAGGNDPDSTVTNNPEGAEPTELCSQYTI